MLRVSSCSAYWSTTTYCFLSFLPWEAAARFLSLLTVGFFLASFLLLLLLLLALSSKAATRFLPFLVAAFFLVRFCCC